MRFPKSARIMLASKSAGTSELGRAPVFSRQRQPEKPGFFVDAASERQADRLAEAAVRDRKIHRSELPATSDDRPLSPGERAFFEPRLGHDFSRVRIHADQNSAAMAKALSAEAFTVGNHIYLGSGKLDATVESDRLLAHELAHVRQQARSGLAIQPKLTITGTPGNIARVKALLETGLFGFDVSVDAAGKVTIDRNKLQGPPTLQQQALANRLTTIINDSKDVVMTVSAHSSTLVGSYATGDIDIADIEQIGVHALIHEIEEQYQKQTKGLAYGSETSGAHGEGIKAESEVKGAVRGPQKIVSATSTGGVTTIVVEVPFTFPDGKVKTQVMTITGTDVTSVTWR